MEDFRKKFEKLISTAKLKDAFALAKKYIEEHSGISQDVKNQLLTLEQTYSSAAKNNLMRLITHDEWVRSQNQVSFALLELDFSESAATAGDEPEESAHIAYISQMTNKKDIMNMMQTIIGAPELMIQKEKQIILFLASNSTRLGYLRLDTEFAAISARIQEFQENFVLRQGKDKMNVNEIQGLLLDENPHIIHFSGHGMASRNTEIVTGSLIEEEIAEGGLVIKGKNGEDVLLETSIIEDLFSTLTSDPASKLKIIVLNACFSEEQADVLCKYVPYVIGMQREIKDAAAIEFSMGFYRGISAEKSVEMSVKLARNQMRLQGFKEDADVPILLKMP